MILIVGLGNPGPEFKNTRHNVGFRVLDEFVKGKNFSDFRFEKKFNAEVSEGQFSGQKIILAKPQSFMNLSGDVVKDFFIYFKLLVENLFIVHDEIDIPFSGIKISKESGAAGHKGVGSIIEKLKTKDFVRFRIGIQPKKGKPKNVEKFVLQKFNKEEDKILREAIEKAVNAIEMILEEGLEKTMTAFNN